MLSNIFSQSSRKNMIMPGNNMISKGEKKIIHIHYFRGCLCGNICFLYKFWTSEKKFLYSIVNNHFTWRILWMQYNKNWDGDEKRRHKCWYNIHSEIMRVFLSVHNNNNATHHYKHILFFIINNTFTITDSNQI